MYSAVFGGVAHGHGAKASSNEIVITNSLLEQTNLDYKVSDTINLSQTERETAIADAKLAFTNYDPVKFKNLKY